DQQRIERSDISTSVDVLSIAGPGERIIDNGVNVVFDFARIRGAGWAKVLRVTESEPSLHVTEDGLGGHVNGNRVDQERIVGREADSCHLAWAVPENAVTIPVKPRVKVARAGRQGCIFALV